jgi:thiol-disulfide isomerase/thioredoxin
MNPNIWPDSIGFGRRSLLLTSSIVICSRLLAAEPEAATDAGKIEIPAPAYVNLMLARDPAVQAELKLKPAQVEAIRAAVEEVDHPLWQLRDVSPTECGDKLEAQLAELQLGLSKTLSADQLARFDQIVMQARGAKALNSTDIRDRLRLSDTQATQVASLVNGATEGKLDAQQLLAVLSGEQQQQLNSLFGPQFDLSRIKRIGCMAPELRGVESWINSPPLTLKQLRGKVVVVHFWAFGCINCVRNLPHYQSWYEKFPQSQVTIIGIQTPETAAEREIDNLRANVTERQIKYPVAFDAQAENWKAWANNMWPSVYLVDRQGQVRTWWYGELNWQGAKGEEAMRKRIASLLAEK